MNQETTTTTHEHRQRGTLRITTHTTGLDQTSPHIFMPHTFMPSRKICREATNARQRGRIMGTTNDNHYTNMGGWRRQKGSAKQAVTAGLDGATG